MSALIDFEKIAKVFTRLGEKAVVVVPGMEPVVLVPLAQYDELTSGKQASKKPQEQAGKPQVSQAHQTNKNHNQQLPKAEPVEKIDPLQGGLEDDDQYFPEPL